MNNKNESLIFGNAEDLFSEEDSEPGGILITTQNKDSDYDKINCPKEISTDVESWKDEGLAKIETNDINTPMWIWIMWSTTIQVLNSPFYFSTLGLLSGVFVHLIAIFINYLSYCFIFSASFFTNSNFLPNIVGQLLGQKMNTFFKFSLFCDMTISYFGAVLSFWNIFQSLLIIAGFTKKDWFTDGPNPVIKNFHPEVFLTRCWFYVFVFLLCVPLLLKKKLREFKLVLNLFFAFIVLVCVLNLIQMPQYLMKFRSENRLVIEYLVSDFSSDTIQSVFNILTTQVIQNYILGLKEEVPNPCPKKLNGIAWRSVSIIQGIFFLFGVLCYLCMGKNTPTYIFEKENIHENCIFHLLLLCSLVIVLFINCMVTVTYNPGYRLMLSEILSSHSKSGMSYYVKSILPFFLMCLLSFLFPNWNSKVYVFGCFFCFFNSYVIPGLLKLKTLALTKKPFQKIGLWIYVIVFLVLGVFGNVFQIYLCV